MTPARPLNLIYADVVALRAKLRRAGIDEATLDHLGNLFNESFRRGVDYAKEEQ